MVSSQPKLTKYVDPHYDYHKAKLLTQKSLKKTLSQSSGQDVECWPSVSVEVSESGLASVEFPLLTPPGLILNLQQQQHLTAVFKRGRIYRDVQPTVSSSAKWCFSVSWLKKLGDQVVKNYQFRCVFCVFCLTSAFSCRYYTAMECFLSIIVLNVRDERIFWKMFGNICELGHLPQLCNFLTVPVCSWAIKYRREQQQFSAHPLKQTFKEIWKDT